MEYDVLFINTGLNMDIMVTVRFEVLMIGMMKMIVFWDVILSSLVGHFGCFHLQCRF
jgi:hypothetical protein